MILLQDIMCTEVERAAQDSCLDNHMFYYSTPLEFVNMLKKACEVNSSGCYPFVFINSMLVDYDIQNKNNVIVNVGEVVISTKSNKNYTSIQRDEYAFKPILLPFYDKLVERLNTSQKISIIKDAKIKLHYFYGSQGAFGYEGDLFDGAIDAIQLTNFQFRIPTNKKC